MGPISESGGTISFDVTVTNTGRVAGKDVVEVYYDPPYTNGGIEKASANLVAFDKTELLEPGKSQTLTLAFQAEAKALFVNNSNYVIPTDPNAVACHRHQKRYEGGRASGGSL